MPRWFQRKKKDINIEDAIKSGPYIPPPSRENEVQTVDVPPDFEPIFAKAEETVAKFFDDMEWSPIKGSIIIGGNRYLLMSAESFQNIPNALSQNLEVSFEKALKLYYKIAKFMGQADARRFIYAMGVTDPVGRLSAGPVHFAFTGNARVSFLPSNPTPDENYLLRYDHPQSFEADVFIRKNGPTAKMPICMWNAGYSAGWCSEAFGINLDAQEISCRAMNHKHCRFVMAPPKKLEERVKETLKEGF
ncbi:MAG: V4R domain-containing protein [Candidatus Helarchaeales archaeon]